MNKDNLQGKIIYYHDRFFAGDMMDPMAFSTSIFKSNDFNELELSLNMSFVGGDGLGATFNLDDEDQRTEALQIVSKLSEGFGNLLSALKKVCENG